MDDLRKPVTAQEMYLYDIAVSLRKLTAAKAAEPEPGTMAIKEGIALADPSVVGIALTPIPDNFPGRFALKDSGIDYLEEIPRDGDQLMTITGIGKVTANQILTWLSA
jgi:hypothetical protein